MQAMARKEKAVIFETFIISIPYVVEFFRTRRYLKGVKQLSERATEKEYVPIPEEKWEALKKKMYAEIGKKNKYQEIDKTTT
jgi:hypothetical protein